MFKSKLNILFISFCFLVVAHSAETWALNYNLDFENACSDQETWTFKAFFPNYLQSEFNYFPDDNKLATLKLANLNRYSHKKNLLKYSAIINYLEGRTYYKLGLLHLAQRKFFAAIATKPIFSTLPVLISSIACLNKIHSNNPSFNYTNEDLDPIYIIPLAQISKSHQNIIFDAITLSAIKKITKDNNLDITKDLNILNPNDMRAIYINALYETKIKAYASAIKYFTKYIDAKNYPDILKNKNDVTNLLLGTLFTTLEKNNLAIKYLNNVSTNSPFYPDSILAKSWAYLNLKNLKDAIGTSYNLQTARLKDSFAPDSLMLAAMGFFETCHYPEALSNINYFKKSYFNDYQWLKINKARNNLYKDLTEFLEKKSTIPQKIVASWFRTPDFISSQNELNIILDEKNAIKLIYSNLKENKNAHTYFIKEIVKNARALKALELKKVADLNSLIKTKTNTLFTNLKDVLENISLLEIEILTAASKDIIRGNTENRTPATTKTELIQKKDLDRSEKWEWGSISGTRMGEEEIWDDELGFLKADLSNRCQNTR